MVVFVTTTVVGILAVALGVWATWFALANRAVTMRQLVLAVVIELMILVQAGSAAVALVTGHRGGETLMFCGYLVVSLFLVPVGAAWAFAERTRWSSAVLAGTAFGLLALQARLWQLWGG